MVYESVTMKFTVDGLCICYYKVYMNEVQVVCYYPSIKSYKLLQKEKKH